MSVHPEADGQLLLTGSTGFTGKHLLPAAEAQGFNVVCLKSDIRDLAALTKEIASTSPSYVVHLAGISNAQCCDEILLHETNVTGTKNLLQALLECGKKPRRILLFSSALVYGASPVSPVTESHELFPINPYAQSKIKMEEVALGYRFRLPVCIVRPFNYSGINQPDTYLIPKIVKHFAHKRQTIQLGNINVKREFNDVRYLCNVCLRLLQADKCKDVYNICSGRAHTIKDVLKALEKVTGHKVKVEINPAFVREKDINLLCGSTARLEATIGNLETETMLGNMLKWMVDGCKQ